MISHNYVVPETRDYVELLTRPAKSAAFHGPTGCPEPRAAGRNTALPGTSGQQVALLVAEDLAGSAADELDMRPLLTLRCGVAVPLLDRMEGGKYLNVIDDRSTIADKKSSALWQVFSEGRHDALPFYRSARIIGCNGSSDRSRHDAAPLGRLQSDILESSYVCQRAVFAC